MSEHQDGRHEKGRVADEARGSSRLSGSGGSTALADALGLSLRRRAEEGVAPGWVRRIAATPAAEQVAMIRAAGS